MNQIFHRREVVPIIVTVKNWLGAGVNPSQGVLITIYKPDGTIAVEDEAMDPLGDDGEYIYYYYSAIDDPVDWWRYVAVPTDGTGDTTKRVPVDGSFKLI